MEVSSSLLFSGLLWPVVCCDLVVDIDNLSSKCLLTAAILPKSTYQRFVTLLPEETVASSLRNLFPHVTPALDISAKVEIKSISQNSIAQEVSLVLQGVGYREVRIQDNEVSSSIERLWQRLALYRWLTSLAHLLFNPSRRFLPPHLQRQLLCHFVARRMPQP